MLVKLLGLQAASQIEARFDRLDVRASRSGKDSIGDLNHETADTVYVVSYEALSEADWPRLRVRLAQANRYYVVVGAGLNSQSIMSAARDGAFDVLLLEDDDARWLAALQNVVEAQKLWLQLYGGAGLKATNGLLGQSGAMKSLRQTIERLGPTGASVLILGESGVGKEMVANALHLASGRGPFVALNCAAIPKELMEAELFGAERGAYTGALKTREGLIEQAAAGTLFLDEIGEMDLRLQPKLLRFLETRKTRRVGGKQELQSEVRVLSATNSNLEIEIAQGKFRSDLYYRLSEVILHVTPLRTRVEDIAHLSMVFMKLAGERLGKHFESIEPELVEKFRAYEWPGNVRELRNAVDRMVIMYDGPVMRSAWWDVPKRVGHPGPERPGIHPYAAPAPANGGTWPASMNRKQKLDLARQLLEASGNDLTWVAAQLGVHPTTLYRWRKMNKL